MKPSFDVAANLAKRTVYTRLSGTFREDDMRAWCEVYRREATERFGGRKHMVIADIRGLKMLQQSVARILGEEIAHARNHGVVLCAHISDETVQRLQMARVARQNAPYDDVTVDVSSLEEAYALLDEARKLIDDRTPSSSIRGAIQLAAG